MCRFKRQQQNTESKNDNFKSIDVNSGFALFHFRKYNKQKPETVRFNVTPHRVYYRICLQDRIK